MAAAAVNRYPLASSNSAHVRRMANCDSSIAAVMRSHSAKADW
jgi:hypothetical protein